MPPQGSPARFGPPTACPRCRRRRPSLRRSPAVRSRDQPKTTTSESPSPHTSNPTSVLSSLMGARSTSGGAPRSEEVATTSTVFTCCNVASATQVIDTWLCPSEPGAASRRRRGPHSWRRRRTHRARECLGHRVRVRVDADEPVGVGPIGEPHGRRGEPDVGAAIAEVDPRLTLQGCRVEAIDPGTEPPGFAANPVSTQTELNPTPTSTGAPSPRAVRKIAPVDGSTTSTRQFPGPVPSRRTNSSSSDVATATAGNGRRVAADRGAGRDGSVVVVDDRPVALTADVPVWDVGVEGSDPDVAPPGFEVHASGITSKPTPIHRQTLTRSSLPELRRPCPAAQTIASTLFVCLSTSESHQRVVPAHGRVVGRLTDLPPYRDAFRHWVRGVHISDLRSVGSIGGSNIR